MTTNEDLFILISGTITFGVLIVFIVYFILLYRKTQVAMLLEQEQMRQALLTAEIEVREQTLVQVSQELHDNLGQLTSLISINLKMLDFSHPEKCKQRITDIQGLVGQLTHDIKNLSYSLNGERIQQFGWSALVIREVERMRRSGLVAVHFEMDPTLVDKVSTDKALAIFRVIQELFSNTLKHSNASNCSLILTQKNNALSMHYTDNGKGFDSEKIDATSTGLYSIKKRCADIGATPTITSAPGEGISVTIHLKLT